MNPLLDETGKIYGTWHVDRYLPAHPRVGAYFVIRCAGCGLLKTARGDNLRTGAVRVHRGCPSPVLPLKPSDPAAPHVVGIVHPTHEKALRAAGVLARARASSNAGAALPATWELEQM